MEKLNNYYLFYVVKTPKRCRSDFIQVSAMNELKAAKWLLFHLVKSSTSFESIAILKTEKSTGNDCLLRLTALKL